MADDLRSQILDGSLQEGDRVPSEADYGVSRIVVRDAVKVLASEGLVIKRQGAGTFVRALKPQQRRIVGDFYGSRPTSSPFARASKAAGQAPEWEYQSRATTAPKAIATRLNIAAGDPVMRTNHRFFADDTPVMLSTSYEPLAITEGTPVEQPEAGPVTGVIPRMDAIGVNITHVTEEVTARAPRPYETENLRVPAGVAVLAIERTYYADDLPVETADIIVAADRYTLAYKVPIPPAEGA
ncbi:GntR family transcriptional regulator [Actinocorallia aurantiaca]|uniref:GntR family transcriptional regulator n=1 Tax=Actinocorallia aurantiaca TaxID=46204 RepID=UPI0031CF6DC1